MGKRSDFERIDKDFYRTFDKRAGDRLAPFLRPGTRYIEPCAGAGDLIDQLQNHGHFCMGAIDLEKTWPQKQMIKQRNALDLNCNTMDADCYITNPPWTREVLHPLIEHLSSQLPTWLLFDADWACTKQAKPYLEYCRKIVAIGRLKWIPDTTMSGKDSACWYLFDQNDDSPTIFYGRK